MKFKVLHEFKHGHLTLEVGNSHDSEVLGIDDGFMMAYCRAGFVEIDGQQVQEINTSHQEVIADNVQIKVGVQNG